MTEPQADVPDDIFQHPLGPKVSAKDMGEKLKQEVRKAKKRKQELKPPSKAEGVAKKYRININKRLAPHYYDQIGVPMSWLKPPLKKLANRDYNQDHMWEVQRAMEETGPNYPWKPAVVCIFEVTLDPFFHLFITRFLKKICKKPGQSLRKL